MASVKRCIWLSIKAFVVVTTLRSAPMVKALLEILRVSATVAAAGRTHAVVLPLGAVNHQQAFDNRRPRVAKHAMQPEAALLPACQRHRPAHAPALSSTWRTWSGLARLTSSDPGPVNATTSP